MLVPQVGVELADLAEYGRRQRNAALDAPFKDEIRGEVAAAVQDHPLDRPVFAAADVLEGVFEKHLPHLRRSDALDVVEQLPHDEREQRAAPVVFRELLEHHLGDLEYLGAALRFARAVHQRPPGRVELVRRGDRLRKTPEMLGRAAVEAEIPGRLLHRCVPRLLRAQVVREPVPAQRLAAHLPRYLRRLEVAYRSNVSTFLGKPLERGLGGKGPTRLDGLDELLLQICVCKGKGRGSRKCDKKNLSFHIVHSLQNSISTDKCPNKSISQDYTSFADGCQPLPW